MSIEKQHNDVLFGRGGGINSHPGNMNYRYIVSKHKRAYNLAANKQEKARISQSVIDAIHGMTPRGRFLMKANRDDKLWTEVDISDAMKKTSQALREGAPSIRASAIRQGEEVLNGYSARGRKSRRTATRKTAGSKSSSGKGDVNMAAAGLVPVTAGNNVIEVAARAGVNRTTSLASSHATAAALLAAEPKFHAFAAAREQQKGAGGAAMTRSVSIQLPPAQQRQHGVDVTAPTPPISPQVASQAKASAASKFQLDASDPTSQPNGRVKSEGLKRINSLATSDVDPFEGVDEPAKNPFAVEGEQLNHTVELSDSKQLLRDISVTSVEQLTFDKSRSRTRNSSQASTSISLSQLSDLPVLSGYKASTLSNNIPRGSSLRRLNSLALSDIDNGELNSEETFKNPFNSSEDTVTPTRGSLKRSNTDRSV
mmetsp:Transcript_24786/g.38315  ORF Transcript_24786/g.38315 Transcript_24786/m.38315 type:complete len:426 (-) Transcript_24786:528-1805(-)|eukprot:CAMPEP_0196803878 /NCGR_PEP_ID=MMETSP1362-20130617/3356_1 /TAXON_ID=163516 /ORGANISM="Leptocylindrus danicus, Strain CCMP1856" /LENGTH=425 /DNA_ID=CAMNT_0042175763 /DNA_START=461 /DNA_END=1738 /DNA_ORIENTATION=-